MDFMLPQAYHEHIMEENTPSFRYKGGDYTLWKDKACKKLIELLGLPLLSAGNNIVIEYKREQQDFIEIRFIYEREPGFYGPAYLLLPKKGAAPFEVVICLQGHSKGAHISLGRLKYEGEISTSGDRDFAIQAINQGYAAIVVEQRGFGELGGTDKGPDCHQTSVSALLVGRTTLGERVWDIMRIIDVIITNFTQVDANKISIMGNSGGGTVALYAAAVDDRIYKAMPSCSFCGYTESIGKLGHCICNYVPHIFKYFDMSDIVGLIAPRPVIIVNGREDPIFPIAGALEGYEHVKSLFAAAGAEGRCALVIGDGGHRFYTADAWPVYKSL